MNTLRIIVREGKQEMANGDCIEDDGSDCSIKPSDIAKLVDVGMLPENKITYCQGPKEFKVLDETEEYYVIEIEGKPGAIEKSRCRAIKISTYIT